ncbi:thiolase family protein [Arthrobacter sp. Marseille-P9274]|uniref:thiolase family protein n=1 Tax=Arthrobacter sp. Marseille-P9274 TaxID=2866572 RepID=UPI0021C57069|nr:thiolase family protein [Arthrobacter sp. Marseille-P9274]
MTIDALIVDALRTSTGRGRTGGALAEIHPVDLLAQALTALVERSGIDPGEVDDVLIGCVSQTGEQSATPGRMAWLAAGYPVHVPATTIDRKCGSSQQAVHFAAQGILSGAYDMVIAGGIESMSRVPMGSARAGADPFGPTVTARYSPGLVSQGVAAELVAAKFGASREAQDEYAARSHRLAAAASAAFEREIVPVTTPDGTMVERDETPRPDTTTDRLAGLKPVFETPELAARFPQVNWSVTAGNSSQISDAASLVLMVSDRKARELGLEPRARVHAMAAVGDDPLLMLTAPIPATEKILARSGMQLDQLDHFEVNEAFAPVPLAWQGHFNLDIERVNPRGGAIALGHPLGASGTRLLTTMLHALEDNRQRYGLQVMCEAGGMANATIIERL